MTSKQNGYVEENREWNREKTTLQNFSFLRNLPFPNEFKNLLQKLQNGTSISNKQACMMIQS